MDNVTLVSRDGATEADWPLIAALLTRAKLPLAGAREQLDGFLLIDCDGRLAACGAVEPYGAAGLLRSVAVDDSLRGHGMGQALVRALVDRARRDGLRELWLMTTTAEGFFPKFGFERVPRSTAPPAIQDSIEFQLVQCQSAAIMRLAL